MRGYCQIFKIGLFLLLSMQATGQVNYSPVISALILEEIRLQPKYSVIDCDMSTLRKLSFKFDKKVLINAQNASEGKIIEILERHKYVILPFKFWDKKRLMKVLVLGDNIQKIEFHEKFIILNDRDTYKAKQQ